MATNNAINLNAAGIASYDGAGTFSALASPLVVANGGTGASSLTAYAVICAGTSSTNPFQSIAGVGTSGQVLKSNGAGALPTFQAAPSSSELGYRFSAISGNPADSTTYWFNQGEVFVSFTSFSAALAVIIPRSGTINTVRGVVTVSGTLGSATNCTVAVRLNNTTDTNVTTTLQLTAASQTFSNTTLGIAVSAGDYVSLKFIAPAWATNPTSVALSATLVVV